MATLGGNIVLFGGSDANNGPLGDTWIWDGHAWTQGGTGPSARTLSTMATFDGAVVLFGGATGTINAFYQSTNPLGDTWIWNGSAWSQSAATGPLPRYGASMAAF